MWRKRKSPTEQPVSPKRARVSEDPAVVVAEPPKTCPLSLEPIAHEELIELPLTGGHVQHYDVKYLWEAINADYLQRDPMTRAPLSDEQIEKVISQMTALRQIAPTSVHRVRLRCKLRKQGEDLKEFLIYMRRPDLATVLENFMQTQVEGMLTCSFRHLASLKRRFRNLEADLLTAVRRHEEFLGILDRLPTRLWHLWLVCFVSEDAPVFYRFF